MLNAELRSYYTELWKKLEAILPKDKGISLPLLISPPPEYESAKLKLMVVGQETNGWGYWGQKIEGDPINALQNNYTSVLHNYRKGAFHPAARKLQRCLIESGFKTSLVWANIFTCSQNNRRLDPVVTQSIGDLQVLANEVRILKPNAVVFFTGSYEVALNRMFGSDKRIAIDGFGVKWLARMEPVQPLPANSFRTYHPSYLMRKSN